MRKQEFLLKLDELLELEPGSLTGSEALADLEMWDSMTMLGFIALVDEQFELTLSASRLAACETTGDLISLLDGRVTD